MAASASDAASGSNSHVPYCPEAALNLCELTNSLRGTNDGPDAIITLEAAAKLGGADAAFFVWSVQDEGQHRTCRSLSALDNRWAGELIKRVLNGPSDWLGLAAKSAEPMLLSDLGLEEPSSPAGPAKSHTGVSVLLVPAPSAQGPEVFGLLGLACRGGTRIQAAGTPLPLFRALAMELSDWFRRRCKDELVRSANLTERDLELLRHEAQGHGSKRIGSALAVQAKTIDCRFHRLNMRLGVANRRDAVRLCRLYGLL